MIQVTFTLVRNKDGMAIHSGNARLIFKDLLESIERDYLMLYFTDLQKRKLNAFLDGKKDRIGLRVDIDTFQFLVMNIMRAI